MRLFEFELPKNINQEPIPIPDVIAFIKKHCSNFINDGVTKSNKFLYRGVSENKVKSEKSFIGKSLDFRPSSIRNNEVNIKYQIIFDLLLKYAGFDALRTNSIFCTSNINTASSYIGKDGNTFIIFPMNGFKYTYSDIHSGKSAYQFKYDKLHFNVYYNIDATQTPNSNFQKEVINNIKLICNKFIKENKLHKTNISKAMIVNDDIWFTGQYVAVNIEYYDILESTFLK